MSSTALSSLIFGLFLFSFYVFSSTVWVCLLRTVGKRPLSSAPVRRMQSFDSFGVPFTGPSSGVTESTQGYFPVTYPGMSLSPWAVVKALWGLRVSQGFFFMLSRTSSTAAAELTLPSFIYPSIVGSPLTRHPTFITELVESDALSLTGLVRLLFRPFVCFLQCYLLGKALRSSILRDLLGAYLLQARVHSASIFLSNYIGSGFFFLYSRSPGRFLL